MTSPTDHAKEMENIISEQESLLQAPQTLEVSKLWVHAVHNALRYTDELDQVYWVTRELWNGSC